MDCLVCLLLTWYGYVFQKRHHTIYLFPIGEAEVGLLTLALLGVVVTVIVVITVAVAVAVVVIVIHSKTKWNGCSREGRRRCSREGRRQTLDTQVALLRTEWILPRIDETLLGLTVLVNRLVLGHEILKGLEFGDERWQGLVDCIWDAGKRCCCCGSGSRIVDLICLLHLHRGSKFH